ncbi:MAG: hypothetical protein M3N68_07270 [Actinomycetota bacterium]|nr:hypothetical protein [Actinomycetota bacterium]
MSEELPTVPPEVEEGEGWVIERGEVVEAALPSPAWRDDGVSDLTYSNPFRQTIERVWFDGKVVFATELGEIDVDVDTVPVAQEYQIVYDVELDERLKPVREPERVEGQYNIYDSVPGMDGYSPLWQFNYVVVPQDYVANTLRSERDCLDSGYPIHRSNVVEN